MNVSIKEVSKEDSISITTIAYIINNNRFVIY